MSIKYKIAYMETIGERIKRLRKERDLTQKQVGAYVGVKSTAVTQWEQDQTHPNGKNLVKLAEVLRVTPSELLGTKKNTNGVQEEPPPYMHEQLRPDQIALLEAYDRVDKRLKNAALRVLGVDEK